MSSADAGNDDELPASFRGYFHLQAVDAINLRLEDDRTFRWTVFGCDVLGEAQGVWSRSGDAILLRAAAGDVSDSWVPGGEVVGDVDEVELVADGEQLTAKRRSGGRIVRYETWVAGAVCAECGDQLGPTGLCECADPFALRPCE